MSMKTTGLLLEQASLSPELLASVERLREVAEEDWISSIVYGRASQDRHKLMRSINDQLLETLSWFQAIRWYPDVIVRDADRSASEWRRREREEFENAMSFIEEGNHGGFATWEPSRAGRDLEIFVQLRKACRKAGVLYLTHGRVYDLSRSDDTFSMGFEFLRAEADANTARERQLRTVKLNAERGRPHGRLPFGYRRVYDDRTGALLRQEIDPPQAQVLIDAVDSILDGGKVSALVAQFNKEGRPLPQGPQNAGSRGWCASSLRSMLTNPTIAGLRVYRGEVLGEANWPGIISVEKWEQVRKIIKDPARRIRFAPEGNHSYPKWLLSHIARCQFCGRPVVRIGQSRDRQKRPSKEQYGCVFQRCRKVSINMQRTDDFVTGALIGWLSTPENIAMLLHQKDDWADKISEAETLLADLQERHQQAAQQFAAGLIDVKMLIAIQQELTPQIEAAAAATVPPITDHGVKALVTSEDIEGAWDSLEILEKRRLMKLLLDVRIGPANKMGGRFQTDRIHITPRTMTGDLADHRRSYSWKK